MIAVKDRRELEEVAAEDHLSPGKISDRPMSADSRRERPEGPTWIPPNGRSLSLGRRSSLRRRDPISLGLSRRSPLIMLTVGMSASRRLVCRGQPTA
jgi:hypothetical protein